MRNSVLHVFCGLPVFLTLGSCAISNADLLAWAETESAETEPPDPLEERTVGRLRGVAGISIEDTCHVEWDVFGEPESDMDLRWNVEFVVSETTCDWSDESTRFTASPFTDRLEVAGGNVYVGGDYWGLADYGNGQLSWSTGRYVVGAQGGRYSYDGSASY